jgi:hypothetical protein
MLPQVVKKRSKTLKNVKNKKKLIIKTIKLNG